jgi:hypothetical protein
VADDAYMMAGLLVQSSVVVKEQLTAATATAQKLTADINRLSADLATATKAADDRMTENQNLTTANRQLTKENATLTTQNTSYKTIISSTLGKISYIMIFLGALLITAGVIGGCFLPSKLVAIRLGVAGLLLVVIGGILAPLVMAAAAAVVWFFWGLVAVVVSWVGYTTWHGLNSEKTMSELVASVDVVGSVAGKTIKTAASELDRLQSPATKETVNRLTKALDIR